MIPKGARVNRIVIKSLNKTNDFDSLNYEYTHNYQVALIYINTILAFTISLLGLLLYRSHLISSLLCLEGIILFMFVIVTVMILNTHLTTSSMIPIVLLVFAACEAALGLSLLVIVSNTYGVDHVQNLNLLQC
uniref:NADH-ubiquinone oxidoreductase chain 4L n=1 Tax=Rhinolophus ferrumequinum TaxID=59479 RepID=A0A671F4V0_RHIFE